MPRDRVVPETADVNDADFRVAMVAGLARAQKRVGGRALAYVMDLTPKGLSNLFSGTAKRPDPKRLFDALSACPTVLDDITDLYGVRLVASDDVAIADHATLPVASLLQLVAEAEHPDSPGGAAKTHTELLDMENEIRAVNAITAGWIDLINRHRGGPRAVA